jgi:NhaP-type Na+/H+ or K+/H+ antiporter
VAGFSWRPLAILSAALGCFSAAAVMGGSGFIGAFVGGVLFGITSGARTSEDARYTARTGLFFDAMSFLLVGAVLLPAAKGALTPAVALYAVLSLVVVRMISVALASIGSRLRAQTVAFMGWFGPRGLATVVFTMLLLEENVEGGTTIAATAVVGVILSVVAHGLSAPPLVARYARWWDSVAPSSPEAPEAEGVHEHATPARLGAPT